MKNFTAFLCRSASAASLVPRAGLLASMLASAVLISACGGGGDSSSTTPTPSTAPTLSFASASKQATLGDADFTQAVSAVCSAQSGYAPSISYSSSTPTVASVDAASGKVSVKAVGDTVISANVAAQGNCLAGSQTYALSVSRYSLVAKAGGGNYDKTECVKDGSTGRIWEGKPASGNRGGLDTQGEYTNYDSSVPGNKQDGIDRDATPADVNASTNSISYVNAVNAAGLCGYNDWRMPTKDELLAIVDTSVTSGPTIDAAWFPNTQSVYYWTSSSNVTSADYFGNVWVVDFRNGLDNDPGRSNLNKVRLVR